MAGSQVSKLKKRQPLNPKTATFEDCQKALADMPFLPSLGIDCTSGPLVGPIKQMDGYFANRAKPLLEEGYQYEMDSCISTSVAVICQLAAFAPVDKCKLVLGERNAGMWDGDDRTAISDAQLYFKSTEDLAMTINNYALHATSRQQAQGRTAAV